MSAYCVMIVDDSEADQFLSRYIIESISHNIKIVNAYDGEEALEIINQGHNNPDLIILDINMPRMNGLDFLSAYQNCDNNHSEVVMLSSTMHEEDKVQCLSFPQVKNFLSKPLIIEDVVALLKPE